MEAPAHAVSAGMVNSRVGTHTSRTIMLAELRLLMASLPGSATPPEYRSAVVVENVLLKRTLATRHKSFRCLRELYALAPTTLLFRALRDLWDDDPEAQPLLAILCAVGRDVLLRATAETIVACPPGDPVTPAMMTSAVRASFPDRFTTIVANNIGRNVISSWQQAGHLSGRLHKTRVCAACRPAAVAYALLLGHVSGERGEGLFGTLWCRMLDAPDHIMREQAIAASRLGLIDYRSAGDVTEISFRHLLRDHGAGDMR